MSSIGVATSGIGSMQAVVDTGFLSALLKIDRIDLVFKVVDRICITFEVYEELSKCKELVKSLIEAMKKYPIELIESEDYSKLKEKYPDLGKGELSVIASAKGKIAFIEDRKAEKIAKEDGNR